MRSLGREEWPSVERINQRQGFLVSAILHLTILMILVSHPPIPRRGPEKIDPSTIERKELVSLPPPAVLRQLVPRPIPRRPATPAPAPAPTPPPPDSTKKDGVSAGPRSALRTEGPIDLDHLIPAKGIPSPRPPSTPAPAPSKVPPGPDAADASGSKAVPGGPGLRLPRDSGVTFRAVVTARRPDPAPSVNPFLERSSDWRSAWSARPTSAPPRARARRPAVSISTRRAPISRSGSAASTASLTEIGSRPSRP